MKRDTTGFRPPRRLKREIGLQCLRIINAVEATGLTKWRRAWRLNRFLEAVRHLLVNRMMKFPAQPVICSTAHGFKMLLNPARDALRGIEPTIFLTGTYETGTLHVFRKILRRGDVVIDIGANIGLMSLYAAKLVGKAGEIMSFEPMMEEYDVLLKNIHLNRFEHVHAHNIALGAKNERKWIYAHPEINRGSSSLVKSSGGIAVTEVEIATLDDFLFLHPKKNNIRLVKIDVEGWELEVLKGAKSLLASRHAPALCVEYSSAHPLEGGELTEIWRFLSSVNSYRCFKLMLGKEKVSQLIPVRDVPDLPTHDNLFCFLPYQLEQLEQSAASIFAQNGAVG